MLVLLDVHQDVFNPKICGEGFPDWALDKPKAFPFPIDMPYNPDEQGYILPQDC